MREWWADRDEDEGRHALHRLWKLAPLEAAHSYCSCLDTDSLGAVISYKCSVCEFSLLLATMTWWWKAEMLKQARRSTWEHPRPLSAQTLEPSFCLHGPPLSFCSIQVPGLQSKHPLCRWDRSYLLIYSKYCLLQTLCSWLMWKRHYEKLMNLDNLSKWIYVKIYNILT